MTDVDLAVVGAGPAGMAAAACAANHGLSVLLLDEQPFAGGQIYRNIEQAAEKRGDILGRDYTDGLNLAKALHHSNVIHVTNAVVWQIEDGTQVAYSRGGQGHLASARRILLATGALERPMPVPGWTLPGVMTAGAAQILLKQSGLVPERAVLAGTGPLLYLIAVQMIRAGLPPLALVETQTHNDLRCALHHLPGAMRGWRYLLKGATLLAQIRRAGVPRFLAATEIAIEGQGRAEALTFRSGGKDHKITCDTVLLHHGVVPNTQSTRSIGVPHHWVARQRCFVPERDLWGRTPVETVFVAGDSAGIAGAMAAAVGGRLAALEVACDLGALTGDARDLSARPLLRKLKAEESVRPFIDTAFPPYQGSLSPQDDTVVCRCEEVTAGDIRHFAGLGCLGPNQLKSFCRAGMGPCQGRFCGLAVTEILSCENGTPPEETGYFRIRPPLKPVTLGEIASLTTVSHKNPPIDPV